MGSLQLCNAQIDKHDGHTINVVYNNAFRDKYIRPEVKLEIGPLASMVPFDHSSVKPYAAEVFPELFENGQTNVTAVKAERTFWEKITILHVEAHRPRDKPQPARYSRHYYDVFKMLNTDVGNNALKNLDLLADVVSFKQRFYSVSWAKYELAVPATIRLIPNDALLKLLKDDYDSMKEMIYGEYPDFDLIISVLYDLQIKLNMSG